MAGPLLGMMRSMGGAMFGTQIGQALGVLAGEVVGSTDVGLPLGPAGKAALLPVNIAALRHGPGRAAGGGAAVPRPARGRPPAALRPCAVAAGASVRRRRGLRARHQGRHLPAGGRGRPARPVATRGSCRTRCSRACSSRRTPRSRRRRWPGWRRRSRWSRAGWTRWCTRPPTPHLPSAGALRETLRRRRATGGPAEQTFATLIGLELRPRRLRDASRLWASLTDARGVDGRDGLWAHPDMLPTAADLDDPDGFVHRESDDEEFDFAALDKMLGEAASGHVKDTLDKNAGSKDAGGKGGDGTADGGAADAGDKGAASGSGSEDAGSGTEDAAPARGAARGRPTTAATARGTARSATRTTRTSESARRRGARPEGMDRAAGRPEQERLRLDYLDHLADHPDGMWKPCRAGHITASALVVDPREGRVLLTLHKKIELWLQTGGHCEPQDATLADAALREATEESGIAGLTLLPGGPVRLDRHQTPCALAPGRAVRGAGPARRRRGDQRGVPRPAVVRLRRGGGRRRRLGPTADGADPAVPVRGAPRVWGAPRVRGGAGGSAGSREAGVCGFSGCGGLREGARGLRFFGVRGCEGGPATGLPVRRRRGWSAGAAVVRRRPRPPGSRGPARCAGTPPAASRSPAHDRARADAPTRAAARSR